MHEQRLLPLPLPATHRHCASSVPPRKPSRSQQYRARQARHRRATACAGALEKKEYFNRLLALRMGDAAPALSVGVHSKCPVGEGRLVERWLRAHLQIPRCFVADEGCVMLVFLR